MPHQNQKNPRIKKLQDFRHRGKHPGVGVKKCGVCSGWMIGDRARERQQTRLQLLHCLKESSE